MKREELIRRVAKAAKAKGLKYELLRHHGGHDIYICGGIQTPIPRHTEIGPKLEFEIYKSLEPVLGPKWWR